MNEQQPTHNGPAEEPERRPPTESESAGQQDAEPSYERRPDVEPPRVWIGSLADYNNGVLHGEWMDAAVSEEELRERIQAMLARSEEQAAEEWMISDYDNFGPYRVGEYEDLETLTTVARGIRDHGPAFAAWAELHDGDPSMLAQFEDAFLGEYESAETWARELLADSGLDDSLDRHIPASLRGYVTVDYQGFARDAQLGGDVHIESAPDGRIWIFAVT